MKLFRGKDAEEPVSERQPLGIPDPRSDDVAHFYMKLRETTEAGGGVVRIYLKRRGSRKLELLTEFSAEEAYGPVSILKALMEDYGPGDYIVNIYGKYNVIVGEYEFYIGDTEDWPESDDALSPEMETLKTIADIYTDICAKLFEAISGDSNPKR